MTPAAEAHRLGLIITIITAAVYGAWPAMARGFYNDGGNVVFLLMWAQLARLAPLLSVCIWQKHSLFRVEGQRRQAVLGGVLQAVSTSLIVAATALLPGPIVIIILFTHTLMLLFYSAWRGELKLDRLTVMATLVALMGLSFVIDLWHLSSAGNLLGMGMAFLSAILVASRLYVYGHLTKTAHPAVVGAENFLIATFLMPLLLLFQMPQPPATSHGYMWALAACATLAAGTLGQFYAIKLLGSFRFSLLLKLEPLFTTIFSALLVDEILKPAQYAGILLVVGSLALYQVIDHKRIA